MNDRPIDVVTPGLVGSEECRAVQNELRLGFVPSHRLGVGEGGIEENSG
jgi:hypothetical protein